MWSFRLPGTTRFCSFWTGLKVEGKPAPLGLSASKKCFWEDLLVRRCGRVPPWPESLLLEEGRGGLEGGLGNLDSYLNPT